MPITTRTWPSELLWQARILVPQQVMDDDWDDAVLNEQARLLRQECQGHAGQVSGAPAPKALSLAGKRSATALGLGRGRSRRKTSDMRAAAQTEATAKVPLRLLQWPVGPAAAVWLTPALVTAMGIQPSWPPNDVAHSRRPRPRQN